MKASRELDAIIAEKVMGWAEVYRDGDSGAYGSETGHGKKTVPHYSTSIAAAWTVVEKLDEREIRAVIYNDHIGWYCGFQQTNADGGSTVFKGEEDSAPRAICLAALRALGVEA